MPNGLHLAASGLRAQQALLDAVANDLANASTTGYKKARVAFQELVTRDAAGASASGVRTLDAGRSWSQGALLEGTGPLSLALEGPGFFQVRRADGSLALTRDGSLRLDGRRQVVTSSGDRLEPPLTIPQEVVAADISVARNGTVRAAGREIGKVVVVDVPATSGLRPLGGGLLQPTSASGAPAPAAGTAVVQGYLESSNVDVASSMVAMVEAQRGFELASRAIRTHDQLLDIANGIRRR
jgi:flagellar basal-body rod protein FlgG